jgi:WD40 repeat protein
MRILLSTLLASTLFAGLAGSGAGLGPPTQKQSKLDACGDPLPVGASARFGTVKLRHGGQISCMALSPDKKLLVSGELGQFVHVWDTATGKELKRIYANLGWTYHVAFSPDGKLFAASAAGNWLQIWDRATFKEVQTLKHATGHIHAFAFSPDSNTLVSCGQDFRPILWDVRSGKTLRRLKGPTDAVTALAFAPNGKTVAAGSIDKMVHIWDTATGRELAVLPHKQRIELLAFSPDGKTMAVKEHERDVRYWDLCCRQEIRHFLAPVHTSDVLAFSPDSETLAIGAVDENNILRLWDSATGKECRGLKGHYHATQQRAISADGKFQVSGYGSRALRLGDTAGGKDLVPLPGHQEQIRAVAFSRDARTVASASYDGTARLWDSATGKEIRRFAMPPRKLTDGWSPPPMFSSLAISPDGQRLAAASNYGRIRLFDKNLDKLLWEYNRGGVDWVFGVTFSPDGKMLAHGSHDNGVHLVDIAAGKEIRTLKRHKSTVDIVLFAPDNKTLLSGSRDGNIRLWDWATGKQTGELTGLEAISAMALSRDGKTVAAWGGGSFRGAPVFLWNLPGSKPSAYLENNGGMIEAIAFSPDGRMLALGTEEGSLLLVEIATRGLRCRLEGHRGAVQALAFSRDGRKMVTGSADTSALVWELWSADSRPERLSRIDLDRLWNDLASADAGLAFRSIGVLQYFPKESLALIRERLRPIPPPDPKKVAALIADLDHPRFKVRQNAMLELEKMDEGALPALHDALEAKPSLEKARRIQELLAKIREPKGKRLHEVRGVEVLEYLHSPEALALLQTLSRGVPHARLTVEALQAQDRLKLSLK